MQTQNTIEIFPSIQKFFQPLVFGHGWENTEKELYFAFLTCIQKTLTTMFTNPHLNTPIKVKGEP